MSWRHVFDCKVSSYKSIDIAAKKAAECGYKFLAWNDEVLFLREDGRYEFTGIHVEDLT